MKKFTHNGAILTQPLLVHFPIRLQEAILFCFLSAFIGNEIQRSEFYLIFSTLFLKGIVFSAQRNYQNKRGRNHRRKDFYINKLTDQSLKFISHLTRFL